MYQKGSRIIFILVSHGKICHTIVGPISNSFASARPIQKMRTFPWKGKKLGPAHPYATVGAKPAPPVYQKKKKKNQHRPAWTRIESTNSDPIWIRRAAGTRRRRRRCSSRWGEPDRCGSERDEGGAATGSPDASPGPVSRSYLYFLPRVSGPPLGFIRVNVLVLAWGERCGRSWVFPLRNWSTDWSAGGFVVEEYNPSGW